PVDPFPSPASRAEEAERARAVEQAVSRLPPKQRAAVVLRYYEGLSGQEAAAAMATTVKAVERLLARARAVLYESLGGFLP
ncbi:MAG: sigma-70 family RNA polymerase sigma factor, partial [Patescibacteria group bacterium]|nr:sigma-70 family RNA polymerase sigma factor [Patescibacteria group bacterium]